ncbi:chromosome partitioning protein ParA [Comamonas testosteroni]|uniref:chromosome partitioning protein ParA n=1 Tax=Comamonas testosteroni TaxID=285 RepID=UPI00391A6C29
MNKIIVVGHPQSGFEDVEELLLDCGMAEAMPSRREGFMAAQISETLVKVHGAVPVQHVCVADQLAQIEVAPVWQGMALDLMLANMEQPLWGWADAQAVYLLDYWKSQDPQTVFVLVFDEPQSVFTRQALEHADASPQEQEARINGWVAYNSALLHFHLRHPQRSLLVHAAQVQTSAHSYLQQLSLHVDAQLHLPSEAVRSEVKCHDQDLSHGAILLRADMAGQQKQTMDGNALAQWLAQQLLEEYPQAGELYEQLQAAASLPQGSHAQLGRQLLAEDQVNPRRKAWAIFVAQQKGMQGQMRHLQQLGKTLDEQARLAQERQAEIEQLTRLISNIEATNQQQALQMLRRAEQIEHLSQAGLVAQQRAEEQQRLLKSQLTQLEAQGQEKQLLLKQLHKVQEELESRYLQAMKQEKALTELNKVNVELLRVKAELKAAQDKALQLQRSEEQLKKQLLMQSASDSAAELEKENELLLAQLHKVQEELEFHYLEHSKLKEAKQLKPVAYYGAANRVKQQLSYRLGATMIKHSRSVRGWLGMPFALHAELQRYKQRPTSSHLNQKLPPIEQYCDAYEAEHIKQHLSYRLGAQMIANSRTLGGWISMPWSLLGEVKAFRKLQK